MNELPELSPEFLELLNRVTGKRARTVIEHILDNGFITTEELSTVYGYNHPPRAARDVREQGVPLVTFKVIGTDGRKIGAYRFGDASAIQWDKLGGRRVIPKELKEQLIASSDGSCFICLERYEGRFLQLDHRIPYEIAGNSDIGERKAADYMLLCGACNRAKSWSCEHCPNWAEQRLPQLCEQCYWAHPEAYTHVATESLRRIDLTWIGEETAAFDELRDAAVANYQTPQRYIKMILLNHLKRIGEG